jgi:CHASE3 domain sensor protein
MLAPIAAVRRWNRRRSRLTAALVSSPVAFGLLVVALLAAGWNYLMAESSRDRVAEHSGVVLEIERLFSAIKDLETGERGFVLVGGENYLIPYDGARDAIDRSLARLTRITHGHADALAVDGQSLIGLVAAKRDFAARVVALRKEKGFEAATELVRTSEGKRTMDAIRAEVATIRQKLSERVDKIQRSDRLRGLLLAVLTGVTAWGAVALLAWVLLLRREEGRRIGALLEGVLEHAPVGLGFLDHDLRLRHRNRALARLGGSGFGGGLGQTIWAAMPALEEKLSAPLHAALRQGVATADIPVPVASRTMPGGVRHLRMSFYPLTVPNEEGHPEIEGVGIVVAAESAAQV